jgi:hypothetical protein
MKRILFLLLAIPSLLMATPTGGTLTVTGIGVISGPISAATFISGNSLLVTTGSGSSLTFGTGSLTLGGNLTTSGAYTCTITLTGNTAVTFPTSGTLVPITVQTGTLVAGVATETVPSGCHPWVQDTSASPTGSLSVTVSGTTATITDSNLASTDTFTLYNAGSQ